MEPLARTTVKSPVPRRARQNAASQSVIASSRHRVARDEREERHAHPCVHIEERFVDLVEVHAAGAPVVGSARRRLRRESNERMLVDEERADRHDGEREEDAAVERDAGDRKRRYGHDVGRATDDERTARSEARGDRVKAARAVERLVLER